MIVYITTNLINNKKYIGKDVKDDPSYLGSGKIFKQALLKYGKKNFQKEIIGIANNKEELCELEIYYIDYYNAQESDLFYNITKGGDGGITHDQSLKKVKVYQFDKFGNFIKEWESAKDAANSLFLNRPKIVTSCSTNNLYNGFFWSKLKNINIKPKIRRKFREIIQYDKNNVVLKTWSYLSQISKELGFNKSNIHKCCNGKHPSAYGFIWKYKIICQH